MTRHHIVTDTGGVTLGSRRGKRSFNISSTKECFFLLPSWREANEGKWGEIGRKVCVCIKFVCLLVCFWCDSPQCVRASSFTSFLDHTQRRNTVGRTPLDEWSARHRDLYLTTHNTNNRQASKHPAGFEPIPASEQPQAHALDRAANGIGM